MFFCAKKIVYLSLYERGEKLGPAGFAGIYGGRENVRINVQVKSKSGDKNGRYPVFLITQKQDILLGDILLEEGKGCLERIFFIDRNKMVAGNLYVGPEDICGIRLEISDNSQIKGIIKAIVKGGSNLSGISQLKEKTFTEEAHTAEARTGKVCAEEAYTEKACTGEACAAEACAEEAYTEETCAKEAYIEEAYAAEACAEEKYAAKPDFKERKEDVIQEAARKETQEPVFFQENIPADKWEQLKKQYKRVHPFGDGREFISIELRDFVVLREKYQKLVNNSFLLHGFYNYRHLILGKDYKIGENNDICFYLGVPGVFFEREKMVAVMFGFEGFECAGSVEIGKFGYYLRQVEL